MAKNTVIFILLLNQACSVVKMTVVFIQCLRSRMLHGHENYYLCNVFDCRDVPASRDFIFPKQCLHLRGSYLASIELGRYAKFCGRQPTCLDLPKLAYLSCP